MLRTVANILTGPAVAALVVGCLERPAMNVAPQMPPAPPRLSMVAPTNRPAGDQPDPLVSQVAFRVFCDVLVVEAAGGALSDNAALWRHLREDSLGVRQTDHLGRNGLRVGVGRSADVNAVTRMMLGARDAKVRQGRLRFESDSAMDVLIDAEVRERRAFVFGRDGAVSGDEYPPGVIFYWVQAWHDIEHIDAVNLTLVPEVRYGRVRERFYTPTLKRAAQYRDVGRLFDEVKIQIRQGRGAFVVLSPNLKSEPALVVGRALLTRVEKGQTRETVLLIRPRVVRTPNR